MTFARRVAFAVLVVATLQLGGCMFSVSPLYTAKELVYDPALVGSWTVDTATWKFEKAGESAYKLTLTEHGTATPAVAHLVQLGEHRFLDLCPDKSGLNPLKQADLYKNSLIPGHLFLQVLRINPSLQIKALDEEWLSKLLEKEPKTLAHEVTDDGLVLTADTKSLQGFMLQHWNTPAAWGDATSMTKRQ